MRLLIVSGRSGSGKSVTLKVLEDLGYYCVDNIPVSLLPSLVDTLRGTHSLLAISLDARNVPSDLNQLKSILEKVKAPDVKCEIIYLDADDKVILKRYSETRRKHPLSRPDISLQEALLAEKSLLNSLANVADLTIDTTNLSNHQLHTIIKQRSSEYAKQELNLQIQSFGFKNGLPVDADFIFDVRCLPNPYWQPELKTKNGLEAEIIAYLDPLPDVQNYIKDITQFLINWIPKFEADKRCYLTIAIGCTGGHHRSVYVAEAVKKALEENRYEVKTRHRDL